MRRILILLAVAFLLAGFGACFLYFSWAAPLLDGDQMDAFAFGPQGATVRDLAVHSREDEGRLLERLLAEVNQASLSQERVELDDTRLLIVFFRTDGLQYHLFQGEGGLVGVSEGGRDYMGALSSPALHAEMQMLSAREDWQAEQP